MLYRDNEGLKLSSKKVIYTQHSEQMESFITTEGVEWWEGFARKWSHTTILGYEDIIYTEEELARYGQVKDLKVGDGVLEEYIFNGIIGEGLEGIKVVEQEKVIAELVSALADKGVI